MRSLILLMLLAPLASADCIITWNPNPANERVTGYVVDIDGQELKTTQTTARCSEFTPPVNERVGQHTVVVYAENEFGRSEGSTPLFFGLPTVPASVSVARE